MEWDEAKIQSCSCLLHQCKYHLSHCVSSLVLFTFVLFEKKKVFYLRHKIPFDVTLANNAFHLIFEKFDVIIGKNFFFPKMNKTMN
jgi:hypothetical protein